MTSKLKPFLVALLLILQFGVQSYAQHVNFTQKLLSCKFTVADKAFWPQINNSNFNFAIEQGHYSLACLESTKKAFAPLRWDKKPEVYKLETNVRLESSSDGAIGLVFCAQNKLQSGYIVQINKDQKYRICIIEANIFKPLTGQRTTGGWVDFKALNKAGEENKIVLTQENGVIIISFNDVQLITFHNKLPALSGEFGFLLTGKSKATISDFTIYGEEAGINSEAPPAESAKAITTNPVIEKTPNKLNTPTSNTITKSTSTPVKDTINSTRDEVVVNSGNPASSLRTKAPANSNPKNDKKVSASKKVKEEASSENNTTPVKVQDAPIPKDTATKVLAVLPKEEKKVEGKTKKDHKSLPAEQTGKAVNETTATVTKDSIPKNINTLSIALGDARKENLALKKENENLVAELKQVKLKNAELQAYINKYLDSKLKSALDVEQNKNEILSKENEQLKQDNAELKGLKDNISKAKDGDIIIVLSDNLKKEQTKNEELTKKIKELEDKLKAKSGTIKPMPKTDTKPSDK